MNLSELRKECGYGSQKEFSAALGVKQTTVCMWEAKKSTPRTNMLTKLSKVLGVPVERVLRALEE